MLWLKKLKYALSLCARGESAQAIVESMSRVEAYKLIEDEEAAHQNFIDSGTVFKDGGKQRSRVEEKIDKMFHLDYQSHEGHEKEVLCVDGSETMDWLLSGGADGSARLWHYSQDNYQCYRLMRVWWHQPEGSHVTSCAFAGDVGPAVTVTDKGDIFVMGIASDEKDRHHISDHKVVDLRVKREQYREEGTWLLATAAGTCAYLTETFPETASGGRPSSSTYKFKDIAVFPHDDVVDVTEHVTGSIEEGAAIATLSGGSVRMWTLKIEVMQMLTIPGGQEMENFDMSGGFEVGWMAGATAHTVYLWPFANGEVVIPPGKNEIAPVAEYKVNQGIEDLMMDPKNQFFLVQRQDMSFEYRTIVPQTGDADVVFEYGELRLKDPLKIKDDSILVIESAVKSHEMCLRFDDEMDSAVALCGFENGSLALFDLQGDDRGEMYCECRSMTVLEIIQPFVIRFVSFMQVFAYAFGPSTKYMEGVEKPANYTRSIALLDVKVVFKLDAADVFLPAIYAVFGVMIIGTILGLSGAPKLLSGAVDSLMRSGSYGDEAKLKKKWGPVHMCTSLLALIRLSIDFFIGLCSRELVVPITKKIAQLGDCEHPEDGPAFLAADDRILCGHPQQVQLFRLGIGLFILYLIVMVPFALVDGDPKYMSRAEVWNPRTWPRQANRKATVKYIGVLHPQADSILYTKLAELFTKVALPIIVVETTHTPLLQTCGVAFCGFVSLLISLLHRPLVDQVWCAIEQGLQLFTFLSMCCGILSVLYPGGGVADVSLALSVLFFLSVTFCRVRAATGSSDTEKLRNKLPGGDNARSFNIDQS